VFSRRRGDYSVYAHNQCCVQFDQIGIGLTAFSSLRDRFALCTQNFEEYYSLIESGHLPINRGYRRTPEDQARWAIVLPIKNRNVRPSNYRRLTGLGLDEVFRGKIEALKAAGVVRETERALEVTPLGAFFADEVAQQFHSADFVPYPRSEYAEGPLNPYLNQNLFE
jgi:oxygen-independent coproporphyrinogen III oxidase